MVMQLENADDKHMEIIKCLEKENDIYRARENFYVCFVVVMVCNVVSCLCCTFKVTW
jgi:hypothetical protein